MASRTALSNVWLAFESTIQNVDEDGQAAEALIQQRIIEGRLRTGTGADQANRAFYEQLAIANGARTDINLADLGKDALGQDTPLDEIVALIVKHTGTAGQLEIQPSIPAGGLTWAPPLTISNGGALKPGGLVLVFNPGDDAMTVDDGTSSMLRLQASQGNVTCEYYVLGRYDEISELSSSSQTLSSSTSSQSSQSLTSSSSSSLSSSSSTSAGSSSSSTSTAFPPGG